MEGRRWAKCTLGSTASFTKDSYGFCADKSRSGGAVLQYLMPQRYRMRSRLFWSCLWAKKGTPGAVLGTSTITCASQHQIMLA